MRCPDHKYHFYFSYDLRNMQFFILTQLLFERNLGRDPQNKYHQCQIGVSIFGGIPSHGSTCFEVMTLILSEN